MPQRDDKDTTSTTRVLELCRLHPGLAQYDALTILEQNARAGKEAHVFEALPKQTTAEAFGISGSLAPQRCPKFSTQRPWDPCLNVAVDNRSQCWQAPKRQEKLWTQKAPGSRPCCSSRAAGKDLAEFSPNYAELAWVGMYVGTVQSNRYLRKCQDADWDLQSSLSRWNTEFYQLRESHDNSCF